MCVWALRCVALHFMQTMADFLKMYTRFISDYPANSTMFSRLQTHSRKLRAFLQETKADPACCNLGMHMISCVFISFHYISLQFNVLTMLCCVVFVMMHVCSFVRAADFMSYFIMVFLCVAGRC